MTTRRLLLEETETAPRKDTMNGVDMDEMVPVRRYIDRKGDGDAEEVYTFASVESSDQLEVDLHFSPYTDDVLTVSLSLGATWRLIRELATAAALAEAEEG